MYQLNLPEQTVAAALTSLSEQTDIQVLFPYDIATQHQSTALVGNYPLQQALSILLLNTGLHGGLTDSGVITISQTGSNVDINQNGKGKRMNTNKRKTVLATMVGLFAAGGMTATMAQEQVGESARAQGVLDEVIVTAEKREASIQDVPIAITAFSGHGLERAGITESVDLEMVTPGLVISTNTANAIITIRGIGSPFSQGVGTDPSSAVYVDGVYQPRFSDALLSLMDLERVEVLKGPQGTVYGRNAVGGAINFISKKPSNEFGGSVTAAVGNYNLRKLTAKIDVPIIDDKLLFGGAVLRETRDAYTENILNSDFDMDEQDLLMGRFSLNYLPNDEVDILIRAGFSDQEGDVQPAHKQVNIDPNGPSAGATIISDPRKVMADSNNELPKESYYVNTTIKVDLNELTLTSITAYNDSETGPLQADFDATELPVIFFGIPGGTLSLSESVSQEFVLSSTDNDDYGWLAGLYYFHEEASNELFGANRTSFGFPLNLQTWENETDAYAVFANGYYFIHENLRANVGIRYSSEEKTFTNSRFDQFGNLTAGPIEQDESWESWTPKVGLDYYLAENSMLYFSVSKGFKSGALSPSGAVEPEDLLAYEIGLKTVLFDDRAKINISAFDYDFTDMQVFAVNETNPGTLLLQNAGESDITGLEVEVSALPVDRLQLDLGLSWIDAEFVDFPVVGGNRAGNEIPNTPEFTANLAINYFMPLGDWGELTSRVDYYYSAEKYFKEDNDPRSLQDEYELINARLTLEPNDGEWTVSLYGKNMTDELVSKFNLVNSFLFGSGHLVTYAPPRTYGIEATYNF